MENNLILETRLVGEYCIAPLEFDDEQGADKVLDKLKSIPSIVRGEIYDKNGKLFSKFIDPRHKVDNLPVTNSPLIKFERDYIHIMRPVFDNNDNLGTIYLVCSTEEFRNDIRDYIAMMLVLMISLLILSLVLANFLQRYISGPILELAKFTEKVSETQDYSLRISNVKDDINETKGNKENEIMILYDGFDKMLEQINKRERERDLAENALRGSENKNRSLIEAIPDLIFILDKSGNYTYIKSKDDSILAVPANKLIGKNIRNGGFSQEQSERDSYAY